MDHEDYLKRLNELYNIAVKQENLRIALDIIAMINDSQDQIPLPIKDI